MLPTQTFKNASVVTAGIMGNEIRRCPFLRDQRSVKHRSSECGKGCLVLRPERTTSLIWCIGEPRTKDINMVNTVLVFGALLPDKFKWVRVALVGLSTALSLYSTVRQNQKNAVDAAKLHSRWLKIANAYTDIWENVYASEAKEKLDAVTALEAEASEASNGLPYKKGLMLKWEKHVVNQHGAQLHSAETTTPTF